MGAREVRNSKDQISNLKEEEDEYDGEQCKETARVY